MRRRRFLAGAAAAGTAGLAGCFGLVGAGGSDGDSGTTREYDVGMTASLFKPFEIETTVGSEVVWKNTNSRFHTVTAYEESLPADAAYFASGGFETESAAREGYANGFKGALDTGETFRHTFEVPGRYRYFCVPHERAGMVGEIVVSE